MFFPSGGCQRLDSLVTRDSPIDADAAHNTTSVYTAAQTFPMLPERLSTNITSLSQDQERLASIVEFLVAADGAVADGDVYRGLVINKAKLAYNGVSSWLEGNSPAPLPLRTDDLQQQIHMQEQAARALGQMRQAHGALTLETLETSPPSSLARRD